LAAVHDAGIVHRDLKPGNIFLARGRNDEMEPKLLDFGISKSSGPDKMRLTSAKGLLMGTPFYMSPEASQGLEMTGLSDQYALGVVLYEAATGTNPFAGATTFGEVVRQVTTGDYPPVTSRNPKLSKRMVAIIERAMHLEPNRRFPSMRAMGRELLALAGQRTRITWGLSFSELPQQGAAASDPVGAPPPPVLRRESQRPPAEKKNRFLAPIALVALAVAGAIWMNWPQSGDVVALNQPSAENTRVLDLKPTAPAAPEAVDRAEPPPTAAPEEPVAERVAKGLSEPIGALQGETIAAAEPEAAPPPAPEKEKAAPLPSPPARSDSARTAQATSARGRPARNGGSRRTTPRRAPPSPSSAPAAEPSSAEPTGPDWMVSARGSSSSSRGPDRGTNNAPILD
jgi:serine/threonine-protein kinase